MTTARILIVEDETITAKDLQMTLQDMGYEVTGTASSGEEAVQMAEEHKPDLVLMDIVLLNKMDGIEAAGDIRKRFDIPAVYLTAHTEESTLERAKITEPFGYIVKPFNDRELLSTIETALYKHGMEKKLRENLDVQERLNKILLTREFRIKELKDENELLKKRIEALGEKG